MIGRFSFLAVLIVAASIAGSVFAGDGWVVPTSSEPISVKLTGAVEVGRAAVTSIRPNCEGAIVAWVGPTGRNAVYGDELIRYDTTRLQNRYADLVVAHQLAEAEVIQSTRDLEKEIFELERKIEKSERALEVSEAALTAAQEPEESQLALLKKRIVLAEREAEAKASEVKRLVEMLKLGEVAESEVRDAELVARSARHGVEVARIKLEDAGDGTDPVAIRRLQWTLEKDRVSLGAGVDGKAVDTRGLGRDLVAKRAKLARKKKITEKDLSNRRLGLQTAARAAWGHTPLRSLVIKQGETVVRTIDFSEPSAALAHDASRGYGWVGAVESFAQKGALVIRGAGEWRCDLPAGTYQISVVLGAPELWQCAFVGSGNTVIAAENEVPVGKTVERSAEVVVVQGGLVLNIGKGMRTIMASRAGTVKNHPWVDLGERVRRNSPVVFITPSDQLIAKFRCHWLQVPFFEDVAGAKRRIDIVADGGQTFPGGKVKIGSEPTVYYDKPQNFSAKEVIDPSERTAREITVQIPVEVAAAVQLGAHVTCSATIEAIGDAVMVPAYLVRAGEDGLVMNVNGAQVPADGRRYDQHYLISKGVAPGDVLRTPTLERAVLSGRRFTGEVIADEKVPIVTPRARYYARIQSMVPHGSKVKKGDLVVTLYMPGNDNAEAVAEVVAAKAGLQFVVAAERRQSNLASQAVAHVESVQLENIAADKVAELRRREQGVQASAEATLRAAESELALLNQRVQALEGDETARRDYETYKRRRDILQHDVRRNRLDAVAAARSLSYSAAVEARNDWARTNDILRTRESQIDLNLNEQQVATRQAKAQLNQQLDEARSNENFEASRRIYAEGDGHVFYRNGFNDLTRRIERIGEEFIVWRGLTIAEILNLKRLSFKVQVPERYYREIDTGSEMDIQLEDLDDRLLTGTVVTRGMQIYEQGQSTKKKRNDSGISQERVFDVVLSFDVPEDLQGELKPGLRGDVIVP